MLFGVSNKSKSLQIYSAYPILTSTGQLVSNPKMDLLRQPWPVILPVRFPFSEN
jgi:hypothetical protein